MDEKVLDIKEMSIGLFLYQNCSIIDTSKQDLLTRGGVGPGLILAIYGYKDEMDIIIEIEFQIPRYT